MTAAWLLLASPSGSRRGRRKAAVENPGWAARLRLVTRSLPTHPTRLTERSNDVVPTIDEAQLSDRDEITRFAAPCTRHRQEQAADGRDRGASLDPRSPPDAHFERAEWHAFGSLDHEATLEALVKPAAAAGRPFEPAAAELLAWQQHRGTSSREGLLSRTTDTLHAVAASRLAADQLTAGAVEAEASIALNQGDGQTCIHEPADTARSLLVGLATSASGDNQAPRRPRRRRIRRSCFAARRAARLDGCFRGWQAQSRSARRDPRAAKQMFRAAARAPFD
jgi:hypothetical protein